jgi:ring-1,2-phenylacetyl-CoA epoxidase subunit PaaE
MQNLKVPFPLSMPTGTKTVSFLKTKLEELQKQFQKKFNVIHVLERPPENWLGPGGFLDPETIELLLSQLPEYGIDTEYYICGPEGMMNIVMQTLQGLYIPEENIYKESFIAGIASQQEIKENNAIDNDIEAREVRIIHKDKEHSFAVVSNKTILQAALDDGIDLP